MCQLTYWANNQDGFIATCQECGSFHLAFGTAMVVVDKARFEKIAKQVINLLHSAKPEILSSKFSSIQTGCGKSIFVVSWEEAEALHQLIETCSAEMTAHNMIQLLQNG